jgi:hypothetical protein
MAVASRLRLAEVRTVHRELSALRSAIGWWRRRDWVAADPTAALTAGGGRPAATAMLTEGEMGALFRMPASPREQALWHLLRDRGAAAETALGLDAGVSRPAWQAGQDCRGRRRHDRMEWPYQRPAGLAAGGQAARARLPHRSARAGGHARRGHLPAERPGPDVLPAGG